MRLTLRTMLAYLDDILEPADAQDIQKKIDESEFATNLMHRMRDVTRRLRLAAPKLEGRGMGVDSNTVAEYLDNTLPGERVPDFEKVCLESDVHLAEVVSAHQILALVLGEPAEVNPGMRERMYKLTPKASEPESAPPVMQAPPSEPLKPRPRPEVPDYLREPSGQRSRAALAIALVLLVLIGGGIMMLNSNWLQEHEPTEVAKTTEVQNSKPTESPLEPVVSPGTVPEGTSGEISEPSISAPPPAISPATDRPDLSQPTNVETPPVPSPDSNTSPPTVTNATSPAIDTTSPETGTMPSPTPPENATATTDEVGAPVPPLPAEGDVPTAPAPDENDTPSTATTTVTQTPATPEVVGRLISDREVLLRLNLKDKIWQRLAPNSPIYSGDQLLCLPTYRAALALSSGVNVQLRGATLVEMLGSDAQGVPGTRVKQGRLVLLTVGKPKAKFRVIAGDMAGTVMFGDVDSTVAFDVTHQHIEGTNPEEQPAPLQVDVYVTGGDIVWSDSSKPDGQTWKAPSHQILGSTKVVGLQAPANVEMPLWLTGDDRTPIEQRASGNMEEVVRPDQPVSLKLKELADDRRAEVSSLAVRSLALLSEFESLVTMLNDQVQRASWNDQVQSLRAAVAESPETALKVHQTFTRLRGEKGEQLYRMLWGYSSEQLASGDAARLVEWLDHDDLDFRVLAFWNLNHITGGTLNYRAEYTPARRQQAVAKWRQKLETGQIVPK